MNPDGKAVETLWDIVSVASGVKNLVRNIKDHNAKGAVVDGVGIVVDAAAVLIPGIPGGIGTLRTWAKVVEVVDDVAGMAIAGKSYRAEQQVPKWNKEEKPGKYISIITHKIPEGEGARDRILKYERQRADYLRELKQLDNYSDKHKRP